MSTTSNSVFAGNSRYAQDFQSVIDRAVGIASLPISQLNREKTQLTDQASALKAIDDKFASLQTAVQKLGDAFASPSFAAAVSNPSVAGVTVGAGAMEGEYSVEVTDLGAYATSMTSSAWVTEANPPGTKTTYKLTIGTADPIDIIPNLNDPASVAAAINAAAGGMVRATVVNVGGSEVNDYRISLQSTQLGAMQLKLTKEDGADLQTAQTTGRLAKYIVNGSGTEVSTSSRNVSISTGLTVNLLASDPGNPVDITVSRSSSAATDALTTFAAAYNATLDTLDLQRGTSDGVLAGQSSIYDLAQSLRALGTYSQESGAVSGLGSLGLTLGQNGQLTFSPFGFLATDLSNSADVAAFIGSSTTGGFLKWATDTLDTVAASETGIITSAEAAVQSRITTTTSRIEDEQKLVDTLKERLQGQMAAADALIATMEQQYNYISSLFSSMQTSSQQYR